MPQRAGPWGHPRPSRRRGCWTARGPVPRRSRSRWGNGPGPSPTACRPASSTGSSRRSRGWRGGWRARCASPRRDSSWNPTRSPRSTSPCTRPGGSPRRICSAPCATGAASRDWPTPATSRPPGPPRRWRTPRRRGSPGSARTWGPCARTSRRGSSGSARSSRPPGSPRRSSRAMRSWAPSGGAPK